MMVHSVDLNSQATLFHTIRPEICKWYECIRQVLCKYQLAPQHNFLWDQKALIGSHQLGCTGCHHSLEYCEFYITTYRRTPPVSRPTPEGRTTPDSTIAPDNKTAQDSRADPDSRTVPDNRTAPDSRKAPDSRTTPDIITAHNSRTIRDNRTVHAEQIRGSKLCIIDNSYIKSHGIFS